jgi:hypothetical protein
MYSARYYVGPPWRPSLNSYSYMLGLHRRDWSWEGLRRNPRYQDEARAHLMDLQAASRLESGALFTRMPKASPRAEAWALRSFR